MNKIIVTGSFDDLRSSQVRFLHEASRLGEVHVSLWSDDTCRSITNRDPKFPEEERKYFLEGIRYVNCLSIANQSLSPDEIVVPTDRTDLVWAVDEPNDTPQKRQFAQSKGIAYHVIPSDNMAGYPMEYPDTTGSQRKKVIVSGCYDWLHSGHVRFFEEVSGYGDLYVVIGNDTNVNYLKGAGHPLFKSDERLYMVQAIRYVTRALVSSGHGWLDAEQEIYAVNPDIYAVNEDGDKPEKRAFCESHNIQYLVLKRTPKAGLPRRESTKLRGF
jgi:cytidyltransferase-like protein